MKEICGFEGKDKRFYKTKKECKEADLNFEINKHVKLLENFSINIQNYLFMNGDYAKQAQWNIDQRYIFKMVSRLILRDSEGFIEIINKKKELEKTLEELYKKKSSRWWLQLKWW